MLHLHSTLRYLILLAAIWVLVKMASGMSGQKPFTKADQRPALIFMILMDIQLLIGLVLYFTGSWGYQLISQMSMSDLMKNNAARFFAIEHIFGMVVALILVHIGYATTKKQIADGKKFKKVFWLFFIAILIILVTIPWAFRTELGRGWMPTS